MIPRAWAWLVKLKRFVLKRDFVLSIVVALTIVGVGVYMGWYNNKAVLPNPLPITHYSQEPNNPLSFLANWDGADYLQIARSGYTNFNQTNFFPLYPLVIRAVNVVVSSPLISALLISWASLVGAIYFYLKIIKSLFSVPKNDEAARGVLFFILFPTAIFFLAAYTEALFAFLALGAIYFALRRNYLAAGAFLMPTTATHVTGILVWILVILILLEQKTRITKVIVAGILGGLGLLAYMIYLQLRFLNFLDFITSQKGHGWLKHSYIDIITQAQFFNIIFIILIIIAAIYWWKSRKSFSIYSLSFLLIPLIGRQYGGFNRYALMVFPLPLMLYGYFRDKHLGYSLTLVVMTMMWTYFLFQYAGGYLGG